MTKAKPITMPFATIPTFTLHSGPSLEDPTKYRAIVCTLQYLSLTQPDISYVINKLSQYMYQPKTDHWITIKCLLGYLCGTTDHGIMLPYHSNLALYAFSDVDWVGNKDDFISTSVYLIYLSHNPIS